jgi:hypothetical protein
MNSYHNLPPKQRHVQRLVDHFNADEELWRNLVAKRHLRRVGYPRLPRTHQNLLDLLDLVIARPRHDCLGLF